MCIFLTSAFSSSYFFFFLSLSVSAAGSKIDRRDGLRSSAENSFLLDDSHFFLKSHFKKKKKEKMSVEPPLFPDEPDRATLRTTRMRVPRGVLQGSVATALPCDNFYDVFPEEIGPLGNVVVTDAAELQQWLLVARRVSRADAESQGGCIQYTPPAESRGVTDSVATQFYRITDSDEEVYGRSRYLPHPPRRSRGRCCGTSADSANRSVIGSSNDGCSSSTEITSAGSQL